MPDRGWPVEVLWEGTLYAAKIVYVHADEGWCDAVLYKMEV